MGISLDAPTHIISITPPTASVTVQELVTAIRNWEADLANTTCRYVIDTAGIDDLGGGVTTGITLTLSSLWQIQFWSGVLRGTIKGGNVVGGVGGIPVKNTGGNDTVLQLGAVATTIATTGGSVPTAEEIRIEMDDNSTKLASIDADVSALMGESGGKWEIIGNQMIFYQADNITEIMRFNLFDASGDPSMENVYKRERVP